jgi:hypothetical protein
LLFIYLRNNIGFTNAAAATGSAEQEGMKVNIIELRHFVDFVRNNQLQTESFYIGSNQCKPNYLLLILLGDDEYCPSDSLFFMVLLLVGCLRIFMATRVFFNWVVFCSCVEGFSTRGGLFSKIKCFKHILPSRGLLICMSLDSSRLIHN